MVTTTKQKNTMIKRAIPKRIIPLSPKRQKNMIKQPTRSNVYSERQYIPSFGPQLISRNNSGMGGIAESVSKVGQNIDSLVSGAGESVRNYTSAFAGNLRNNIARNIIESRKQMQGIPAQSPMVQPISSATPVTPSVQPVSQQQVVPSVGNQLVSKLKETVMPQEAQAQVWQNDPLTGDNRKRARAMNRGGYVFPENIPGSRGESAPPQLSRILSIVMDALTPVQDIPNNLNTGGIFRDQNGEYRIKLSRIFSVAPWVLDELFENKAEGNWLQTVWYDPKEDMLHYGGFKGREGFKYAIEELGLEPIGVQLPGRSAQGQPIEALGRQNLPPQNPFVIPPDGEFTMEEWQNLSPAGQQASMNSTYRTSHRPPSEVLPKGEWLGDYSEEPLYGKEPPVYRMPDWPSGEFWKQRRLRRGLQGEAEQSAQNLAVVKNAVKNKQSIAKKSSGAGGPGELGFTGTMSRIGQNAGSVLSGAGESVRNYTSAFAGNLRNGITRNVLGAKKWLQGFSNQAPITPPATSITPTVPASQPFRMPIQNPDINQNGIQLISQEETAVPQASEVQNQTMVDRVMENKQANLAQRFLNKIIPTAQAVSLPEFNEASETLMGSKSQWDIQKTPGSNKEVLRRIQNIEIGAKNRYPGDQKMQAIYSALRMNAELGDKSPFIDWEVQFRQNNGLPESPLLREIKTGS